MPNPTKVWVTKVTQSYTQQTSSLLFVWHNTINPVFIQLRDRKQLHLPLSSWAPHCSLLHLEKTANKPTCLANWSFFTKPVAAAMFPAPSTVFCATAVTPVTTAPPTLDTCSLVFSATEEKQKMGKHMMPVGAVSFSENLSPTAWHHEKP